MTIVGIIGKGLDIDVRRSRHIRLAVGEIPR